MGAKSWVIRAVQDGVAPGRGGSCWPGPRPGGASSARRWGRSISGTVSALVSSALGAWLAVLVGPPAADIVVLRTAATRREAQATSSTNGNHGPERQGRGSMGCGTTSARKAYEPEL